MGLGRSNRDGQRQAAAEDRERQSDQRQGHDGLEDDSAQQTGQRQHGYRGGHQSNDWQEPRRQLPQHDLAVGQVGDKHVRQIAACAIEADRARRGGRGGQKHHHELGC